MFHPLDDHYGLAPLEAAGVGGRHCTMRPRPGTRRCSTTPRGPPVRWSIAGPEASACWPTSQYRAAEARNWTTIIQGAQNAGRPLLLEGGLDWKAMSLSPKDMDFTRGASTMRRARSRCAFGVPPMLLGIPGDNT